VRLLTQPRVLVQHRRHLLTKRHLGISKSTPVASEKYELDSNDEVVIPSVEDKAESPSASTQLNKVYPPVDSKLDPEELNRWKTSHPISTGGNPNENSNEKE